MDLTKYSNSPYRGGMPARGDTNTSALAAALRGVLGQEEPGSVLDPETASNKRINDSVQLGSILTDLLPGKAALKGAALAGALRRGGRPDLYLWHNARAKQLLQGGEALLPELVHPSFGISKGAPITVMGGDTLLIPRLNKVDPRTSPTSLQNRDFWSPLYQDSLSANMPEDAGIRALARARLADRFDIFWPKGGANAAAGAFDVLGALQPMRFPSFAAFENHPRGGNALVDQLRGDPPKGTTPITQERILELRDDVLGLAESKIPGFAAATEGMNINEQLPLIAQGLPEVDKSKIYEFIKALRSSPSEYAEAKQYGPVQLSKDNFAGAIIKKSPFANKLADSLLDRGVDALVVSPKNYTDRLTNAALIDDWHHYDINYGLSKGFARALPK